MGASILLVFIIPMAFLEVFFSGISGALFGYPTAEIALPYDEEKGIVWESSSLFSIHFFRILAFSNVHFL